MQVTAVKMRNATILQPEIETLEVSNGKSFREAVEDYVKPDAMIVLDLSRVRFVDSSGLGEILTLLKHLVAAGGDLRLCSLQPAVQKELSLVHMTRIVRVHDTREEAVAD